MGPSRPAVIAVLVGGLSAVGCLNTEPKEPLVLGSDARTKLAASADAGTPKPTNKVPAFDPTATGGTGVSAQNSFNRTTPGPGTGSSSGNFVSKLPPPQVGLPPAASAPPLQGASFGEPMADQGRTSMTRAATPVAPVKPAPPLPPADATPFGPTPPRLEPPVNEPVRPATFKDPEPPAPPTPIRPVMPPAEPGPLPAPAMPAPVAPSGPLPATPPAAPAPAPAAGEPLPAAPAPPSYVPSPVEVPVPGVQSPPKLPPAPPIRPNG